MTKVVSIASYKVLNIKKHFIESNHAFTCTLVLPNIGSRRKNLEGSARIQNAHIWSVIYTDWVCTYCESKCSVLTK